ncbi:hypothetical protein KAJ77_00460, partial [bacterium]|nr:hypothetical protein [bacterium]
MDKTGPISSALVGVELLDAHCPWGRMTVVILRPVLCAILAITVVSCAGPSRRDTLTMPYEDRLQLASIYIQGGQEDKAVPLLE